MATVSNGNFFDLEVSRPAAYTRAGIHVTQARTGGENGQTVVIAAAGVAGLLLTLAKFLNDDERASVARELRNT